jgi:phosphate transport system ATP-binding protein
MTHFQGRTSAKPQDFFAFRQSCASLRSSVTAPSPSRPSPLPIPSLTPDQIAIQVSDLNFQYGKTQTLDGISMAIPRHAITALIGPSGCGKSTLLRCFNRMNDRIPGAKITQGTIQIEGLDIHSPNLDPVTLRRQVGMVFQKSNPFPRSIFDNVAYGLAISGERDRAKISHRVEQSLRAAALWDEVKDRLQQSAFSLSGGQQQRLCIARSIAVEPSVLLMDEPCSALDPIATARIEELLTQLQARYTIVIVTHNMQQALRIADFTALFYLGRLVEYRPTLPLFETPQETLTQQYVTGRFG